MIHDFIPVSHFYRRISTVLLAMGLLILSCQAQTSHSQEKPVQATITFLEKPYRLGSYNQKNVPMWEFITGTETINNWTTLVTVLDRPDAHTREELDRLSEGIMSNYKTHGGKILMAQTMHDSSGTPFNYMVAAFDEPDKHVYELNFVKAGTGKNHCYVMIYGVRISGNDYVANSKTFLTQHSNQIGHALENAAAPDTSTWPRKEF